MSCNLDPVPFACHEGSRFQRCILSLNFCYRYPDSPKRILSLALQLYYRINISTHPFTTRLIHSSSVSCLSVSRERRDQSFGAVTIFVTPIFLRFLLRSDNDTDNVYGRIERARARVEDGDAARQGASCRSYLAVGEGGSSAALFTLCRAPDRDTGPHTIRTAY